MSGGTSEESNFLALPQAHAHPETAGVVLIPAPFEETSTYGSGSADGPRAMIEASHEVELFDAELGFEPFQAAGGIATLAALEVAGCDGQSLAQRLYREVLPWIDRQKFVVTLGGEHTAVLGALRAHCESYKDLTVLQLDAHSDLRPAYAGSAWNHACSMARVLDFHDDVVQVGIRSQAKEERAFAEERGIPVFHAHEIHRDPAWQGAWVREVVAAVNRNVYITFDCDVFDPSIMPATGTPEPGGLTWRQINALLARLSSERNVVGLDVSELAPIPGLRHPQFTMAKLIYRLIGWTFMG